MNKYIFLAFFTSIYAKSSQFPFHNTKPTRKEHFRKKRTSITFLYWKLFPLDAGVDSPESSHRLGAVAWLWAVSPLDTRSAHSCACVRPPRQPWVVFLSHGLEKFFWQLLSGRAVQVQEVLTRMSHYEDREGFTHDLDCSGVPLVHFYVPETYCKFFLFLSLHLSCFQTAIENSRGTRIFFWRLAQFLLLHYCFYFFRPSGYMWQVLKDYYGPFSPQKLKH